MHNTITRVQNAFGFFTSCAFTLAAIIAFLSIIPFPTPASLPSASISVRNVQVVNGRPHYYSTKREQYAQIRFDLDADLSSLFTWNTKQLFVYVTANYAPVAGSQEISEAVIWDAIIPATATPFSWQTLKTKYFPEKSHKKSKSAKEKSKALVKPGVLSLKNQKPKYAITDPSGSIAEKTNATLQVSWNVQPWVGALLWDNGYYGKRVGSWNARRSGKSKTFDFPAVKGGQSSAVKDPEPPQTPKAGEASPIVPV